MGPLPILLGLFVLLGYIFCAGPTFYWLDSSEFTAAAWGLGVAHPPGHPLPSLLSRLVCLLPVGTLAWRVTLASALQAAGATALTAVLSAQVLRRIPVKGPGWVAPAAICVAALTVGLSYSVWFQAVRAEVYALNLLLLLAGVCLVLHWDETGDRRHLLAASLVCGLALCNHHFLVLLALPAVGLFVVLRRPRPGWRRAAAGVVLCGALGLSTLAYLPLRASQSPEVNWGSPSNPERFWWVVSAKAFHKALDNAAAESVEHRSQGAVFAVVGGLGPVAAVAALGGIYFLLRRRQSRKAGLLLLGLAGLNLLSPLTVGFDPLNADAHGYLSVAVAFLGPGLAVLVAVLAGELSAKGRRRMAPVAVCLVAAGMPIYQAVASLPRCDLRAHWAAEEVSRQMLAHQREGALVLTSYFETIFNLWALRAITDFRADVTVVHRNFIPQPGYVEDLARRVPWVARPARAWKEAGHLLAEDLGRLAAQRPVDLEIGHNLHAGIVANLRPAGLMQAFGGTTTEEDVARHLRRFAQLARAVGPVDELETRRSLTWLHFQLIRFACARGISTLARFHFQQARGLAPRSLQLAALAKSCGLDQ